MSQAIDLKQPRLRPPGVTPRQWRMALLYPRCESAYQAALQAGYKPSTARSRGRSISTSVGVIRAAQAIQERLVDSSRGLVGLSRQAFATSSADVKELEPRDRLALGIKALETAATLGENLEPEGNADRWRNRLRRACRLMARLTEQRIKAQHLVLSPMSDATSPEK